MGQMKWRESYRMHIKYRDAKNVNEWITDTDKVTFSDVGWINLVVKTSFGEQLETIPIVNGRSINLDMLHYYPIVKENLQAEKRDKELVDEAKKENYSTYGKYDFSNSASENLLAGNRRRRAM